MITRPLLEHIFAAASIERWNDHPHPAVFTELGKQAHKIVAAWVLGSRRKHCVYAQFLIGNCALSRMMSR